jgi:DNA-binding PadR family transcriptional regulator
MLKYYLEHLKSLFHFFKKVNIVRKMQKERKGFSIKSKAGEKILVYLLLAHSAEKLPELERKQLIGVKRVTGYTLRKEFESTYATIYKVLKKMEKEGIIKRETKYEKEIRKKPIVEINFYGLANYLNNFLPENDKLTESEIEQLAKVLQDINWISIFFPYKEDVNFDILNVCQQLIAQKPSFERFLAMFQSIGMLALRLKKIPKSEWKRNLSLIFNDFYLQEIEKFTKLDKSILKKLKLVGVKTIGSLDKMAKTAENIYKQSIEKAKDYYQRKNAPCEQIIPVKIPYLLFSKSIDKVFNSNFESENYEFD